MKKHKGIKFYLICALILGLSLFADHIQADVQLSQTDLTAQIIQQRFNVYYQQTDQLSNDLYELVQTLDQNQPSIAGLRAELRNLDQDLSALQKETTNIIQRLENVDSMTGIQAQIEVDNIKQDLITHKESYIQLTQSLKDISSQVGAVINL